MKNFRFLATFTAVLVLLISPLGFAQVEDNPNWKFDTIPAPSLNNNLLEDEPARLIEVYLPPSYHKSEKRYPVIYYVWGYNSGTRVNDMKVKMHKKIIDEKIKNGQLSEMIVVYISGSNRLRGSFYVNSSVTGQWADFIVKDVVGYMDKSYRTLAARESRGIAGSSMGGYGALNLSMLYADVFSAGYGISPGAFTADGFSTSQIVTAEGNIENTLNFIERLNALPVAEAHKEFLKFVDTTTDRTLIFTIAYGAAHAPDTTRAPYFKFPYRRDGSKVIVDKEVWELWQNGFGGIENKIGKYKSNLEKLKVYGITVGYNDGYQWIIDGSLYYSNQLTKNKINHMLYLHQGTHSSMREDVMLNHVFPLFSNALAH